MENRLTRAQREQIIFDFLKGKPNPLYDVQQTNHGKYIVKQKQISIEEESIDESSQSTDYDDDDNDDKEEKPSQPPVKVKQLKQPKPSKQLMRSRDEEEPQPKHSRRAKQDAKRILDALSSIINSNDYSDDEQSEQKYQAPPLVEPNNFNPAPLSYRRRHLQFI